MSDQTPPERIAELEDRIEQLEATIRKMLPGRRDAMKLGGAAALGAAAFSGTASAGSSQVGTIGDSNNLVDIEAEDVNVSDTINGASVSGAAAGEALTSDGSGGLTFAEAGGGIPPNFTYVDQSSNRSLDTTFTNNSGKALLVNVTVRIDENGAGVFLLRPRVDGQVILQAIQELSSGSFGEQHALTVNFFVPDGSDYKAETFAITNPNLLTWTEAEM